MGITAELSPEGGSDGDGSNFHGQARKNDTHQSATDPDSRLYRKAAGREARLSYLGHVAMENRHGLAVAGMLTRPTARLNGAHPKRCSRKKQARRSSHHRGRGQGLRHERSHCRVRAPGLRHMTQNDGLTKTGPRRRSSAINGRTTRHTGYAKSQTRRKMIESIFGWGKQRGTLRKTKHRGIRRVSGNFLRFYRIQSGPSSQARARLMARQQSRPR